MEGIVFILLFILICVCFVAFLRLLLVSNFFWLFEIKFFQISTVSLAFCSTSFCLRSQHIYTVSLPFFSFSRFFWLVSHSFQTLTASMRTQRTKITSASLFFKPKVKRRLFIGIDSFCSWQHTQLSFLKLFKNPNVVTIDLLTSV
jgi:hypothetical protein